MRFILIFIFIFLAVNLCQAGTAEQDEQMRRQIEEVMKARDEILKTLMDDSDFQDMATRMEKLMKSLNDNDDFSFGRNAVVGEYDWLETKTHRILSVKVKQIKDHPLDIKINKGQISFKGDVESQSKSSHNKKISKVHFERTFSLPDDVDQTNPEFENKEGELLIKFKKKIATAPKKEKGPEKDKNLVPITTTPEDIKL